MPVLEGKELRIVAFLCNWCSYGGADTAGVARAKQPTDLRIIRVPCSGRIDPLFILRALVNGADGVLVSGCHPNDCHYSAGNFYARRRLEVLKQFLPILGIDDRRFEYTWVSASEGQRWQHVVTAFTERVHKLGPAPRLENADKLLEVADMALQPLRPLGTGQKAKLDELKAAIKEMLGNGLDIVIGWQEGDDAAHTVPLFMRKPEDVDRLVWGPFNVNNPATYLTGLIGRTLPQDKLPKVGVVVKGCDSRSVVELLQENLIPRENITIFSLPCEGTFDMARIDQELGRYRTIDKVVYDEAGVTITADGKDHRFCITDCAQGKCYNCAMPKAKVSDVSFGDAPAIEKQPGTPPELAMLDAMTLEQRFAFWKGEMERCIRCYACRNACPMCVCKDYCIADSREPHFITQENTTREKLYFQCIHTMHLAGRCTLCGECQRACPMGIPILALRQQIARVIAGLFDGYQSGMDAEAEPPLLTYQKEEAHIKQREL